MRLLPPLNSTSLPWWAILSIAAAASLSSPDTAPHPLDPTLVAMTVLRLSWRPLITWDSGLGPSASGGTWSVSPMTGGPARDRSGMGAPSLGSDLALRGAGTSSAAARSRARIPRPAQAAPVATARWVFPLWKTFHNGNYAEKRIMSGNGLPPQVIRSRQPRPSA